MIFWSEAWLVDVATYGVKIIVFGYQRLLWIIDYERELNFEKEIDSFIM